MSKKLSLSILILLISATLLTSCFPFTKSDLDDTDITTDGSSTSSLIADLLATYSYYDYELTDEQLARAIVAGYKEVTGDLYAYYYNEEEYEALNDESAGENQGIGITVIENTDYSCIEIASVIPGSPAEKAGIMEKDLIVQIGVGENAEMTSELGFEMALKKLQGEAGTTCAFGIVRNEDFNNILEYIILREVFTSESVIYEICAADSTVGIVKLLGFDLTTPPQFKEAMTDLISKGCTSFIYDVRNNPGGDLASVSAILSYFLNQDDVIIITEDTSGNVSTNVCKPVTRSDDYSTCSVTKEEIGMYRKYPAAVLINENSASAAELFTGTMKSYGLATIVGETSFGKGCMQSIISLSRFDNSLKGAIKMTTAFYRPHGMDNYHGKGIEPTEGYSVKLSEEAKKMNIYKLLYPENQALDNQLTLALSALKK